MEGIDPELAPTTRVESIILPPNPRPPIGIRPVHLIGAAVVGVVFITAAVLGYEHGRDQERLGSTGDPRGGE